MGVRPFSGRRIGSTCNSTPNPCNPNPLLFQVERAVEIGQHLVTLIRYIGCTNFEGRKILVLSGMTIEELKSKKELDPHFGIDSTLMARFVPTETGWRLAITFAHLTTGNVQYVPTAK